MVRSLATNREKRGARRAGLPAGSRWPAVLQTLRWVLRPVQSFEADARRYGDVYTMKNLVFGNEIVVSDPGLVREVLCGDPEVYQAGAAAEALGLVLGRSSVLLLDGREHVRQRRLMLPSFHGEQVPAYVAAMADVTRRVMASWPFGRAFALRPSMQRIALEIILRTVFGVSEGLRFAALRDCLTAFLDLIQSPLGLFLMLPALQRDLGPFTPWRAFVRARAEVDALVYDEIGRGRATAPAERGRSVIAALLGATDEDGQPMSDGELRDELITILSAGHETTATALCWTLQEILGHPEVLARVLAELRLVVRGDSVGADELPRLRYLDAVIRETLRLWPPIPFVGRKLRVGVRMRGHYIPPGTLIVPCLYLVHRRADLYPDPDAFCPERFLLSKPDPYAWLPFGGGAHHCLGVSFALCEMKVILATVLKHAHLELARRARPEVSLRSFVFAPRGGTRVVQR